jgi:hypothetical protein
VSDVTVTGSRSVRGPGGLPHVSGRHVAIDGAARMTQGLVTETVLREVAVDFTKACDEAELWVHSYLISGLMPRLLYPRGKSLWNLFHKRMCGSQNCYGRFVEEANICFLSGIEPRFLGFPSRNIVTMLITVVSVTFKKSVHLVVFMFNFLFCPAL